MSIKRFCDACQQEISESAASQRIERTFNGVSVEIVVGKYDGKTTTWNDGDFCEGCVLKAVTDGVR